MVADQLQESRIDRRPDAVRRLAGIVVGLQLRHVLDWDLDLDLHRLQAAGVDDGHVAAGPAEEFRHLFQRALGGGQSDPLRLDFRQRGQSLEAQRQMRATLGGGDRVDLVHDEPPHRSEDPPRRAGEDQEERLRGRDEDVGRVTFHRAPNLGGRVAGADGRSDVWGNSSARLDLVANPHQRRTQVSVHVVGERFQRRYVKDATALGLGRHRLRGQPIEAPEEGGQRLAAAGGGGHEHVPARGHLAPPALLDLRGLREGSAKPVPRRRCEEIESVPHAVQFDRFRIYKQAFVIKVGDRSPGHGR